ncbi:MAG: type I restriction endonuclease subunit M, partial [Myxococcales bacterium]|nr:type I restriction endonuclease subunit M [Myxococcales bacterium]
MSAINRRSILEVLTKARLLELARQFKLDVITSWPKAQVVDALTDAEEVSLRELLGVAKRDELKKICKAHDLDTSGREKQ